MRALAVAVAGAAVLSGCGVPDYVTDNTADVVLRVTDINGGSPLTSDVDVDGLAAPDTVSLSVAVRAKNLRTEAPSIPNAVFLERYEVYYVRSDGRGVEGLDVPFRISGSLTGVDDVRNTGGSTFNVEVVRAQAKLEPPLRNLRRTNPDNSDLEGGGALIITMFAHVTVYGRTVSGEVVQDSGDLQIDFADWPD
jgi:hypothetical protein